MPNTEVEISPLAFSKIIDWASSNTEREVGGYLIGEVKDKRVIIKEAVFAVAESNPTFVAFDNMIQFRIIEELEKKGVKDAIVGWWHTHPGMGVFLSSTDIATQKIYQALLPEAVAMVNDGNNYSRTQKQNDFKTGFFRVQGAKAQKVNYSVMTDPNKLLSHLTEYLQQEENITNIIQSSTASVANSLKDFVATKESIEESTAVLKQVLTETHTTLKKLHQTEKKQQEEVQQKIQALERKVQKQGKLLFYSLSAALLLIILELVFLIILLIRS